MPPCSLIQATIDYPTHFFTHIHNKPNIHFHSARLSTDPQHLFEYILSITFQETSDLLTPEPLIPLKTSLFQRLGMHGIRLSRILKKYRLYLEKQLLEGLSTISRNNALRDTTSSLMPYDHSRDCLQEYFIPCNHIHQFLDTLKKTVVEANIKLLNVTIRFVQGHSQPILSYATQDCFAFVLYFNMHETEHDYARIKAWTEKIIDCALALRGSFYLPYEQLATKEQTQHAYPNIPTFIATKTKYDPLGLFTNSLYENLLT
jgi:decaprenylphospho-beta-D-ribofuranose 2-oxidase